MIEVSVVSYSGLPPSEKLSARFGKEGGTIGRGTGNTLTLADPERHLSRVQARLTDLGGGRFEIANLSHANSIFVGDIEVEPQQQTSASTNATLRMGLHVLSAFSVTSSNSKNAHDAQANRSLSPLVDIPHTHTAAAGNLAVSDPLIPFSATSSVPDPFADLLGNASENDARATASKRAPAARASAFDSSVVRAAGSSATRIPDDFDPFSMPSAASRNSDNPLRDLATGNDVSLRNVFEDVTPVNRLIDSRDLKSSDDSALTLFDDASSALNDSVNVDPLKLFGGGAGGIGASNPLAEFSTGNHASELSAAFALPAAADENKEPIRLVQSATPRADKARHLSGEGATTFIDSYGVPTREPVTSPPIVGDRIEKVAAVAPAAIADVAKPRVPKSVSKTESLANPSTRRARRNSDKLSTRDELVAAFLEGAGVATLDIPDASDDEFMRRAGAMLRASIDGAVDLMSARAVTKREVRAEVTMIVSRGNNPLKFAPDGEAATMQLLGTPFPGFMPPVDAMRDSFDDLRAHQIGVIAGSRAAFSSVLQRFDPEALEARLGEGGVIDSLVPSTRRSKLWLQYTKMFEEILKQAEDDYGTLFGEAFRRAYEEEVDRVIAGKRDDGAS